MKQLIGFGISLVLFGSLTGCIASSPNGQNQGGSGGTSGSAGSAGTAGTAGTGGTGTPNGTPPLNCLGILGCVNNNNCSTNACVDDCMGRGTADAQQQVTDLATCSQNSSCNDSACLQTNCQSQLAACLGGSAPPPTGQPSGGQAPPPGNVPADFVGKWIASDSWDLTSEKEFVLGADGSGEYLESYNGGVGQCASAVIAKYDGSAVIDSTTITIYATTVTETTNTCGSPTNLTKPAVTLTFTYTDAAYATSPALLITDSTCAAQYSDQGSINTYCRYTYYKQ